MDFQQDREDIEDFLALQPSQVQQDCKIVSSKDVGQDFMLRIDKFTPKVFVPNMPKSAMVTENTNTPRITVAPTLIGCMIGYFRIERDVQDGTAVPAGKDKPNFAGGYSISRLPFDHCLKPGAQMVVDSDSSDEHWLVPYRPESVEVEPEIIGQIFVGSVTYLPTSGHHPGVRLEMYLHVSGDVELPVSPSKKAGPGYYRYVVYWPNIRTRTVQDPNCLVSLDQIRPEDYMRAKEFKAALLSREETRFASW